MTSKVSSNWLLDNLIGTETSSVNDDYNGYEQAPYTVIQTYDENIEMRRYSSANWVCTGGSSVYQSADNWSNAGILGLYNYLTRDRSQDDQGTLFWRLFRYIQGENSANQKIEMTVPVTTKMIVNKSEEKLEKLMCFYIPELFQTLPPAPTDSSVRIVRVEEFTAIVKRFGGYVMESSIWIRKAEEFKRELENIGISGYDLSEFTSAGYDSPMTLWNRRNEVMFKKI